MSLAFSETPKTGFLTLRPNYSCILSCTCRFILHLVSQGNYNGDRSTAMLNVVETNPFKHLTHLSLKFVPGSDSDVKKYLADCLKQFKVGKK